MISEIFGYIRDILVILAGSGVLTKLTIDWQVSRKEKSQPYVGGNNGRSYVTQEELRKHAVDCPIIIHKKIEEYNQKAVDQMNINHRETMETFTELKVAIAKLETARRYQK